MNTPTAFFITFTSIVIIFYSSTVFANNLLAKSPLDKSTTDLISSNNNGEAICYSPLYHNVSYQEVLELTFQPPKQTFSYGPAPAQFAELRIPNQPAPPSGHPLVIFIHGGCWLNAYSVDHTSAFSSALASTGYAVVSLEYRRIGDDGGGWPGSYEDVLSGIKSVLELEQSTYNSNNVAIVGHSAGGHLALLAGAALKQIPSIKSVIGLAAITDLPSYAKGNNSCQQATPQFMGGKPEDKPEAYGQANPTEADLHPQSRLIQGTADTIVGLNQTLDEVTVHRIEGAGHFDMIHPYTNSFQTLLKQLAADL